MILLVIADRYDAIHISTNNNNNKLSYLVLL